MHPLIYINNGHHEGNLQELIITDYKQWEPVSVGVYPLSHRHKYHSLSRLKEDICERVQNQSYLPRHSHIENTVHWVIRLVLLLLINLLNVQRSEVANSHPHERQVFED